MTKLLTTRSGGSGSSIFDPSKFHTIFFNPGNATSIEFTTKSLYEGQPFGRLPQYTINGYQFSSWYWTSDGDSNSQISETSEFNSDSDVILYPMPASIVPNPGEGGDAGGEGEGDDDPYLNQPFTIECRAAGSVIITMDYHKGGDSPFYYSKDNGTTWKPYTYNTGWETSTGWETTTKPKVSASIIDFNPGDKIQFKAKQKVTTLSEQNYSSNCGRSDIYHPHITLKGNAYISGNIQYLLDPTGKETNVPEECFCMLFRNSTRVMAAENLRLPGTILGKGCYERMFENCTNLKKPPTKINATIMGVSACQNMFKECTSLTKTPELLTTNLSADCYNNMFYNCTSLTEIPKFSAKIFGNKSCYQMFYGCTSLETTPTFEDVIAVSPYCCKQMFWNCSALYQASVPKVDGLSNNCFEEMFRNCISLGEIVLENKTLATNCYSHMFWDCTSLTKATLGIYSPTESTGYMFSGCKKCNTIVLSNITQQDFENLTTETKFLRDIGLPTNGSVTIQYKPQ